MKYMKSITFFGLSMVLLMLVTVVVAAAMQVPAALAVLAGFGAALLAVHAGIRSLRRIAENPYGAVSSGGDPMHRLYTMKLTDSVSANTAGKICVIGGRVVESCGAYAIAEEGVYIYMGKRIWPKEAALAIAAWAQVYWNAAANEVTTTAAGNTPIGYCVEAAAAADTTVTFLLLPLAHGGITQPALKGRAEVALADADAVLTATQLIDSSTLKITPTVARSLTTPTAALLVAGMKGAQVNTWFMFTVHNLAAFTVTLVAGANVTLVGSAAVSKGSAIFLAEFKNVGSGTEAVTIYRATSGAAAEDLQVASGKILVGQATGLAAAKTPAGTVTMDTDGVFSFSSSGSPLANTIADPGTGAAIPVAAQGVCALTIGAGAETNTMAIPPARGMIIVISADTVGGGSRAITVASAVNQAGNTIMTFGAARDTITLCSIFVAGALAWQVVGNDGVALS